MKKVLPSIIISFGMWSGTAFSANAPSKPNENRYYVLEKHFDGADKKQLAMDLATDLRATLGGAEVWMQGNRPYPGDFIFFVKRKMSDSPLDLEKLRSKYGKVSFHVTQLGGNKMTPQQVEKSMKDFYTQLDYEFYHPLEDMATQLDSYGTPREIQLKRTQEVRAARAISASTILFSDLEIGFRFIDQIGQYIGAGKRKHTKDKSLQHFIELVHKRDLFFASSSLLQMFSGDFKKQDLFEILYHYTKDELGHTFDEIAFGFMTRVGSHIAMLQELSHDNPELAAEVAKLKARWNESWPVIHKLVSDAKGDELKQERFEQRLYRITLLSKGENYENLTPEQRNKIFSKLVDHFSKTRTYQKGTNDEFVAHIIIKFLGKELTDSHSPNFEAFAAMMDVFPTQQFQEFLWYAFRLNNYHSFASKEEHLIGLRGVARAMKFWFLNKQEGPKTDSQQKADSARLIFRKTVRRATSESHLNWNKEPKSIFIAREYLIDDLQQMNNENPLPEFCPTILKIQPPKNPSK